MRTETALEHALSLLEAEGYEVPARALLTYGMNLWDKLTDEWGVDAGDNWVGSRFRCHRVDCKTCDGSGYVEDDPYGDEPAVRCPFCNGRGQRLVPGLEVRAVGLGVVVTEGLPVTSVEAMLKPGKLPYPRIHMLPADVIAAVESESSRSNAVVFWSSSAPGVAARKLVPPCPRCQGQPLFSTEDTWPPHYIIECCSTVFIRGLDAQEVLSAWAAWHVSESNHTKESP